MARARFLRALTVALLATLAAACSHDLTQARSPCRDKPGGWCDFTRDMAVQSWEYAQLSQNAYGVEDEENFRELPSGITKFHEQDNDDLGYAYAIFHRKEGERIAEVILAFRGSESSFDDWISGNIKKAQNPRGLETYRQLRRQLDEIGYRDVRIRLTGHSLGGGIAIHVSLREAGAEAFVFNTSTRFERPVDGEIENARIAVTERGDALRFQRQLGDIPPVDTFVVNCRPDGGAGDHSIRKLAECLTWIAAYEDGRARESVRKNGIGPPPIEEMYKLAGDYLRPTPDAEGGNGD